MRSRTRLLIVMAITCCAALAAGQTSQPAQRFEEEFGAQAKKAAGDSKERVALAVKILEAARGQKDTAYAAWLCIKAGELAGKTPAGIPHAISAMELLLQLDPNARSGGMEKLLDLCQQQYASATPTEKPFVGETLIGHLLEAGDDLANDGHFTAAAKFYSRADNVAVVTNSTRRGDVQARIRQADEHKEIEQRIDQMRARLKANSHDRVAREEIIRAFVVDVDNPAAATRYLDDQCDTVTQLSLPLATGDPNELPETAAFQLARWYKELAAKAEGPACEKMLLRERKCLNRFLDLHVKKDSARDQAAAWLEEINRALVQKDRDLAKGIGPAKAAAPLTAPPTAASKPQSIGPEAWLHGLDPSIVTFVRKRAQMPLDEQVDATASKLKEWNDGNVVIHRCNTETGRVTDLDLSYNKSLRSVQPLANWGITDLRLNNCPILRDLTGLAGAPLERLEARDCNSLAGDLSALAGSNLAYLDLHNCSQLRSLKGLKGLPLTEVCLDNCTGVSDLSELQGSPLKKLSLRNWTRLGPDLSVLKSLGLKLLSLDIRGCSEVVSLAGIEQMPLQEIFIDCPKLSKENLALLTQIKTLSKVTLPDKALAQEILDAVQKGK